MTKARSSNSKHQDTAIFNVDEMSIDDQHLKSLKIVDIPLKRAIDRILGMDMGIIPMVILMHQIDIDAANLLVEHGILIYLEDLFIESDDWDSDGFVKEMPDDMDIDFKGRLARFGLDITSWKNTASIPEVWKSRLSRHGIKFLREMADYHDQLDLKSPSSLSTIHFIEDTDNKQNQQLSSKSYNTLSNNLTIGIRQLDQQQFVSELNHIQTSSPTRLINNNNTAHNSKINESGYVKNGSSETFNNVERKGVKRTDSSTDSLVQAKSSVKRTRIDEQVVDDDSQWYHPSTLLKTLQMNWSPLRKQILSLKNRDRNNYFVNSTIQILASTPLFAEWLLYQKDTSISCDLTKHQKFCSVCELINIVFLMYSSSDENRVPMESDINVYSQEIYSHLDQLLTELGGNHDEDPSLFIIRLLEHCSNCLLFDMLKISDTLHPCTVIDQIFGIYLLSTIKCLSCSRESQKEELHHLLYVEVTRLYSVSKALEHFFCEQTLAGENAYHCRTCNKYVTANKRPAISHLPPVIIISLQRTIGSGVNIQKVMHQVTYNKTLDISPYLTSRFLEQNNKSKKTKALNKFLYSLYAVIIHSRANEKNDYFYTYLRTSQNNTWVKVDDESYQVVSFKNILSNKSVFVLFYAKSNNSSDEILASPSQASINSTIPKHTVLSNDASPSFSLNDEKISSIRIDPTTDFIQPQLNDYPSDLTTQHCHSQSIYEVDSEPCLNDLTNMDVENGSTLSDPQPGYTESQIIIKRPSNITKYSKTDEVNSTNNCETDEDNLANNSEIDEDNLTNNSDESDMELSDKHELQKGMRNTHHL
ncbi:unnamed protein product [Adineta steineri]|uniref:Ubiquitin carboxyl-terminal hydrolase 36 n=1 Tax=Adineta steineri TaxID=433720 RepID=A0A815N5R3_9BILA|nr:unnamed protein product [Adineta steineri]CAF3701503.1 unnamed protein product [Adineta steineri]